MRTGTALWIIGWLFVCGVLAETGLEKNPGYRMSFSESIATLVTWPAVLGYEYSQRIGHLTTDQK